MANGTWEAPEGGWTLAGTSTGTSQVVTYPAEAKDLMIVALSNFSAKPTICSSFVIDQIDNTCTVLLVGGYYFSASDCAMVNVTFSKSNRTVAYRYLKYNNVDGGSFSIYWR